jgi:hypothetical protein
MYTHLNSYNSNELDSLQLSECKVLDHSNTKQTHATGWATVPGTDGGIGCHTSQSHAVGDSTSRKRLSDIICQQEVLGRTNRLFSLIRHGPRWNRRVQQFFYWCVCIRYRGNVSTEPLPSNDRGIHIETHRLMGGIRPLRWAQVPWYTYQVS